MPQGTRNAQLMEVRAVDGRGVHVCEEPLVDCVWGGSGRDGHGKKAPSRETRPSRRYSPMKRVGFLGLGIMGRRMAQVLQNVRALFHSFRPPCAERAPRARLPFT